MAKKVLKKAQMGSSMREASMKGAVIGGLMGAQNKAKADSVAQSTAQSNLQKVALPRAPKIDPTLMKKGGMIKRADGSMSKRGLWDNIRANKGSGKKPTAQMLKQEKKIKAQSKKK